jgi:GTP-binding protein YchF
MKLGIIGLPQAGRATTFGALTGQAVEPGRRAENHIGTIRVPDERVDTLSRLYQPRKTTFAQVEYLLPGETGGKDKAPGGAGAWNTLRDCDAFIHCLRNFPAYGLADPDPRGDFQRLDQELILVDLMTVEKRLERLDMDRRRGKKPETDEPALLARCRDELENERPLRHTPELAAAPCLKGFAFLSAKPVLALFNNADEDDRLPPLGPLTAQEPCLVLRGKLEQELAGMTVEEAAGFLTEFGVAAPAADRVIQASYGLLGLISFFTVGDDEVRAWTIPRGTPAPDAAGVIHTDFKKGFIRAEVLAYADLMAAGTYAEARRRGTVRLEGKTYTVADGDIINFRFNV